MPVSPDVLAACIDDVRSGRVSVDDCVAAHPTVTAELRAILEVATSIVPPALLPMESVARARGRASLIAAIANEKPNVTRFVGERYVRSMVAALTQSGVIMRLERVPSLLLASVLVATAALGGGAVAASGEALPGDALYPVKLTVEDVQFTTVRGDEAKARFSLQKAADRLIEIDRASQLGRENAIATAAASYIQDLADANRYLASATASGHDVQAESDGLNGEIARQRVALEDAKQRTPPGAQAALGAAERAARVGIAVPSNAGGSTISETATPTGGSGRTSPLTTPMFSASATPIATSTPKPTSSTESTDTPEPTEISNNQIRRPSETPRPTDEPSVPAGLTSDQRSEFEEAGKERHRAPRNISLPPGVVTPTGQPAQQPEPTEVRRPNRTPRPTPAIPSPPGRATRPPEPTERPDPKSNSDESVHRQLAPTAVPQAPPKITQKPGSDDHGRGGGNDD